MSRLLSLGISITAKSGAACLVTPDGVVASALESRGHARKPTLPAAAIQHTLKAANIGSLSELAVISLQTRHSTDWGDFISHQFNDERGWLEGVVSLPRKIRQELKFRADLKLELESLNGAQAEIPEILLVADHKAMARGFSQFYGEQEKAILILDTPFERSTTSLWKSQGNQLENLWLSEFPHSLEHVTESLASFSGFRGRMGQRQFLQLAEYGEPRFVEAMRNEVLKIEDQARFSVSTQLLPVNRSGENDWAGLADLFGGPPRSADHPISSREFDLSMAYVTVVQDWIQSLRQVVKGKPVIVRGQGPTQAYLKGLLKSAGLNTIHSASQDESAIMAMGAAIEALVQKGFASSGEETPASQESPGSSI